MIEGTTPVEHDETAKTSPRPTAPIPKQVAGFEILSLIGEGGMGKVFKARQKSLDRIVALKLLPPKLAADTNFVKRFEYEARAAARLNHPNIVQVIEQGNDGDVRFIAFEFIDGPTLEAVLRERGRLPEREALEIVHDIADALDCASAGGLVHRDVKPDNILLTQAGVPKLADLGLARVEAEPVHLTKTGIVMGTPFYMSPEQALGEGDLDSRADLFSLGVVLFRCVTGTLPFISDSAMAILTHNITEDVPDPRLVNPALSENTATLVRGLTARSRNDRYPTPRFAVAEMDGILAGRPASGPRPYLDAMNTQAMSSPVRTSSARRRTIRESGVQAALTAAPPPPPRPPVAEPAEPAKPVPAPATFRTYAGLALILVLGVVAIYPHLPARETPAPPPAVIPPGITPVATTSITTVPPDPAPVVTTHPDVIPVVSETPVEVAPVHTSEPVVSFMPIADLPPDARVWDGHRWRRTEPGHVHGKRCGHFLRAKRWNVYAYDPRPYTYDMTEEQRELPSTGIYDDLEGKTWMLPNHTHTYGCGHVLEKGHWKLVAE